MVLSAMGGQASPGSLELQLQEYEGFRVIMMFRG
jgi:hypothetical protein